MKIELKYTEVDSKFYHTINRIDIILSEEKTNFMQNFYTIFGGELDQYTVEIIDDRLKPLLEKICFFINENYILKTKDQGQSQNEIKNDQI